MTINRLDLLQELHDHADNFLMENFGMRLTIPIHINDRLRSTGGQFRSMHNSVTGVSWAVDIEIAKFVCENGTKEEILDTLKHECIHYALFERSEPYNDNDSHFINTCKRLNVGLYHRIFRQKYTYQCPECGTLTDYHRKIRKGYYTTCEHCGEKIRQENIVTIKSMKVRQVI